MTEKRRFRTAVSASATGLWQWLKGLNAKEIIEGLAKLSAPAAVVIGGILAHNFERSLAMTQLIAAREDADTKIRAEMFKAITDRLLAANTPNSPEPAPERREVFTELLALNFHEHFELKPLLRDVDEALLVQADKESDPIKKTLLRNRRDELVSVVRRVRERQMAMLVRPSYASYEQENEWWERWPWQWQWRTPDPERVRWEHGDLKMLSVRFEGDAPTDGPPNAGATGASRCDLDPGVPGDPKSRPEPGQSACADWLMLENAPDGRGAIGVTVRNADWRMQRFTLMIKPVPRQKEMSEAEKKQLQKLQTGAKQLRCEVPLESIGVAKAGGTTGGSVEFDISWFDMPLTDNTLLSSGSRYAVYIDQICGINGEEGPKAVKFGLIWFTEDYIPPRERPTNYHDIREKLNVTSRPQE